ncbi:MAG: type II toxin-antitoxin system VapC family toxin [Sedimenticolaceae bacterium]
MILLDTNVVSEVMKTRPAETVVAWLNGQDSEKLYVSAITIGEIACGLRILPDGKRRSGLRERFERFVALAFDQRALAFDQRALAYDESAARIYGELMGDRKELGLPMSVPDGQIAAIARLNHLAVATRNVVDFENCGIEVINPFEVAL